MQISPLPDQPPRPASTQLTAGESATPATDQADRSSSTPPQDAGLMQPLKVNAVPSARADTLQVSFNNNTQDSGSHMSQMPGPPFTEDKYSTSSGSDQEICDQEVRNIIRVHTPTEASTVVRSPGPGSNSTVDYSTQRDPDQLTHSPQSGLTCEQ